MTKIKRIRFRVHAIETITRESPGDSFYLLNYSINGNRHFIRLSDETCIRDLQPPDPVSWVNVANAITFALYPHYRKSWHDLTDAVQTNILDRLNIDNPKGK